MALPHPVSTTTGWGEARQRDNRARVPTPEVDAVIPSRRSAVQARTPHLARCGTGHGLGTYRWVVEGAIALPPS